MADLANDLPLIGVTTSRRGGGLMWRFNRFALSRARARALRLVPRQRFDVDRLDALVIGGGDDISADLYGGEVDPTIRIDPERDAYELDLLGEALSRRKPVLGICRGAQMINVHLGGTLHEDIYEVYRDAPFMRTPLPRKRIRIVPSSRLYALVRRSGDRVNALHHQAIDVLGRTLRIAARDQFGIIQAIETEEDRLFVLGVQWHPEFLVFDRGQQSIYRGLVAAARNHSGVSGSDTE